MVSKLGLLCYATHDMLFSRVSFTHTRIRIDGTWEEVQYVCVYCTTNIVLPEVPSRVQYFRTVYTVDMRVQNSGFHVYTVTIYF